ncbi:uncharacterized protein [Dysidea avara]|uniref:uncharacterized protein isoform X2 n=1 Tax=Dysidea avara TaxID=196820 RepID=UPI0033164EFC
MAKKLARRFIVVFGKQLVQDSSLPSPVEDDDLQRVFRASLEELQEGKLKNELTTNFAVYFKQLQRVLSKKIVREKVIPPLVDRRPLLIIGQLDQRLAEIRTCQDPTHQYIQLLLTSHTTNVNWKQNILQHWLGHWNMDNKFSIEDAINIMNCSMIISQEVKVDWLKLCLKIFSHLVDVMPTNPVDAKPTKSYRKLKQMMWTCLFTCNCRPTDDDANDNKKTTPSQEQLLSAILSLYTEYLMISGDHQTTTPDHVISILHIILGHSRVHYLNVVLQISPDKLPQCSLPVLLSLYKYVIGRTSVLQMDYHCYVKYLCCCIMCNRLHTQTGIGDFKVDKLLPAPNGFVHWLHNTHPRLMKKLNLKQSSSDGDVTMVMLYNTTENIIEELLDSLQVIGDHDVVDTTDTTDYPVIVPSSTDSVDQEVQSTPPSSPQQEVSSEDEPVECEDQILSSSFSKEDTSDLTDGVTSVKKRHKKVKTTKQKRLSQTSSRKTSSKLSSGGQVFFVDTTPSSGGCTPPILPSSNRRRSLRKTPNRIRYYQ